MSAVERRLAAIAKLSLKHGVRWRYGESLDPVLPTRVLSEVEKHAIAEENIRHLSEPYWSKPLWHRRAIRGLRRANAEFEGFQAVRDEVAVTVLEGTRSEVMVEMLRRDLDADPVFAEVAAATDSREIREALTRRKDTDSVLLQSQCDSIQA